MPRARPGCGRLRDRAHHAAGAELRPGVLPRDHGEVPRRAGAGGRAPPAARRPARVRPPTTGAGAPSWAGRRCWSARSTAAAPSAATGLVDLTLVAYEFGRHAAPGPAGRRPTSWPPRSATAGERRTPSVLGRSAGRRRRSPPGAYGEPPPGRPARRRRARDPGRRRPSVVLNGVKRPVESAAQADHLLVTGRTGAGLTQVLVPADTAGRDRRRRCSTVDLTRRFSVVALRRRPGARSTPWSARSAAAGRPGRAPAPAGAGHRPTPSRSGAMQTAFDMTVEWAFDRYSFGRPLASYQELKHRFADMKTWLEASHAISDAAAAAVAAGVARRRRAGERGQGLHRRLRRRAACRTACRCTAASA